MQENKLFKFRSAVGKTIKKMRLEKDYSINKMAFEYDFDKGNLSKTERGIYSIHLVTAWKICEALGIKFSDFAKRLEEELGDDFNLTDL